MQLKSQKLTAFRNIREALFLPTEGVNVICGENGQGKTNLLESIFLLTGAKSFRRAKDREMIAREGEGFSVVEAEFFAEGRQQTMRLTISEKGRMIQLNRAAAQKAGEAAGRFCCVVFSPEHLELVKGTPAERRRFLDTALCQLSPRYLGALREYVRLLQQKNTLLKDARGISAAWDLLDIYDEQIAAAAAQILQSRTAVLQNLQQLVTESYAELSGNREALSLSYLSTLGEAQTPPEILETIAAARQEDLRAGFCTTGPHRDDLVILLDGQPARAFGSQGQQRTAVLALKLSEAQLFRQSLGEEPVLLLDDVLSELDERRQLYLLERLTRSQSVITCCEPEFIKRQTGAAVFRMEQGCLTALR